MKKIESKNYCVVIALLVITFALTLELSRIYKNRDKEVSTFYEYSNKITNKEFDEFYLENFDLIIYISDKYDETNEEFEKNFKVKIDELNLKSKLVYIDKKELTKKFLSNLSKKYKININVENLPIIVVILDKDVKQVISVNNNSNVDEIIDYEAFE